MKHPLRITLIILAVWIAAQAIGLLVVQHYDATELPAGIERPALDANEVPWYLLIGIGIGTALVLLLARFRQRKLWAVWFSFAVFVLSYVALSAILPAPFGLFGAALFVWFKLDTRLHWILRNLPELFLYAGIAAVFAPLLTVTVALVILIAISIYDAIAVWQSKHMVKLARFQMESGWFAGFNMPREAPEQEPVKVPKRARKKAAKDAPKTQQEREPAPTMGAAVLGGGDFAFPLIYSGTLLLSLGWLPAIGATVGGYIGLFALFAASVEGRFYPAMPFLSAGLILGSVAGVLI